MQKYFLLLTWIAAANCGFFDLTDIDDPLSVLWQTKSDAFKKKNGECNVKINGFSKYGECKHISECLLTAGSPIGLCGVLSTCCIYENSCGITTRSKVSYFEKPATSALSNIYANGCDYYVQFANPNVCQIRLDFEKFTLAPATVVNSQTTADDTSKCSDDSLIIQDSIYPIPALCGNNDKQHLYIHVNQSQGISRGITLNLNLADRSQQNTLVEPEWKIKITQLECPGSYFSLKHSNTAVQDFNQLAPAGALQYFTERSGFIRSFGFDIGSLTNSFTDNEFYSIGFRRSKHICGVAFTSKYFYISGNDLVTATNLNPCPNGYLFIPEVTYVDESDTIVRTSKLCADHTATDTTTFSFTSKPPGPLNIYFKSFKFETADTDPASAFYLKYDLITCNNA